MNLGTASATKYVLALTTMALIFASLTWTADDKYESDINKRIDASANVLNDGPGVSLRGSIYPAR